MRLSTAYQYATLLSMLVSTSMISTSSCFTLTSVPRAFVPRRRYTNTMVYSTEMEMEAVNEPMEEPSLSDMLPVDSTELRNDMLYTAKSLTEDSPTGIFLTTPVAMDKLKSAVTRLEAITPSMSQREKELLVGDWELLATSRSVNVQNSKMTVPDEAKNILFKVKTPKLSDSIRNSITVLQRVQPSSSAVEEDEVDIINRIDHVIQYTPLKLADLIPENSPLKGLRSWNVNPLEVSQSKITLVHDAEVSSIVPALTTKLALKSVVVNVAGKSQYLDPQGADVLGLNIPSLGEFANSGSFETTYIDENVRVSRNKIGFVDEIRVFVRKGFDMDDIMEVGYEKSMQEMEEQEKTEVEIRLERISDAVANVVGTVQNLDKDVRGVVEKDMESVGKAVGGVRESVQESFKDVQTVVEDDLKKVTKAVEDVRSVVVGKVEEETADNVIVDVDVDVDEADAEIKIEDGEEDDVPSDVNHH